MNSIQRLKLIFHTVLKFKILLLNALALQHSLHFAFKYPVLPRAGHSAHRRDLDIASSSHGMQPSQGRSTTPRHVAGPWKSSEQAAQDRVSHCQGRLCWQNLVPHTGLCSGLQADTSFSCRERQQKRDRRSYLLLGDPVGCMTDLWIA